MLHSDIMQINYCLNFDFRAHICESGFPTKHRAIPKKKQNIMTIVCVCVLYKPTVLFRKINEILKNHHHPLLMKFCSGTF